MKIDFRKFSSTKNCYVNFTQVLGKPEFNEYIFQLIDNQFEMTLLSVGKIEFDKISEQGWFEIDDSNIPSVIIEEFYEAGLILEDFVKLSEESIGKEFNVYRKSDNKLLGNWECAVCVHAKTRENSGIHNIYDIYQGFWKGNYARINGCLAFDENGNGKFSGGEKVYLRNLEQINLDKWMKDPLNKVTINKSEKGLLFAELIRYQSIESSSYRVVARIPADRLVEKTVYFYEGEEL